MAEKIWGIILLCINVIIIKVFGLVGLLVFLLVVFVIDVLIKKIK